MPGAGPATRIIGCPLRRRPARGRRSAAEELRRRREEKLAALLASAARALDRRDGKVDRFDEAQDLLDEATLLSPDDPRVLAFWKRLDAERPARVKALLDEARTLLEARSLDAASAAVDRAVDLQPDSRTALELRSAVRARLNAGSRRAQAGWRIAAGVVVGVGSLAAATLALLPDAGPQAETGELVASAGDAADPDGPAPDSVLDGGPDPVTAALGLAADPSDASGDDGSELGRLLGDVIDERDALFFETGRVDGTSLNDIAGAAFPEERPAAPEAPARPAAPPAGIRAAPSSARNLVRPAAPASPAAATSPAAPIVVVRLCDEDVACGALRVRVQPAAQMLFNGVQVGSGAQGMLRLPAGRHQIRPALGRARVPPHGHHRPRRPGDPGGRPRGRRASSAGPVATVPNR